MQKILRKQLCFATLLFLFILSSPAPIVAQKQTLLRWDFHSATAIEPRSRLISAPASFTVKGISGTYFTRSDCNGCRRTLSSLIDFSYSANLVEEHIGAEHGYLTVTTTAALNLKQIKIKTTANDNAKFFVSLEISPRNAPPPSWFHQGQGYRTLGTFEHEGLADEWEKIVGPGILLPGTYHIRLRSSAPFSAPRVDIRELELIGTPGISIALYPWVPRLDQFKQVINAAWAKVSPDVPLTYVSWDGGYSDDPPTNVEVFAFDGIFLDYFVSSGFLAALRPEEIEAPGDFLPYALNDSKVGNIHYAIPQIGCGNILFYRQDDGALAQANKLSQIAKAVGQCQADSIPPPDGKNLIVDLSGSTTDACLYLEAVQDFTGRYDPNPKLPPPNGLNAIAVANLHSLLDTGCVLPSVTSSDVPYQRAIWFGQGKGRALVGFTESLSAMGDGRKTVAFKLMPFADTNNVTLFYVDLVGINKSVTDPTRRALALKLANLVASSGVLVSSFGPSSDAPYPQYLMPVRKSVFQALQTNDPLYERMYQLVLQSNPRMFRLGAGSRMWLKNTKSAIRQQILSGFMLRQRTGPK